MCTSAEALASCRFFGKLVSSTDEEEADKMSMYEGRRMEILSGKRREDRMRILAEVRRVRTILHRNLVITNAHLAGKMMGIPSYLTPSICSRILRGSFLCISIVEVS